MTSSSSEVVSRVALRETTALGVDDLILGCGFNKPDLAHPEALAFISRPEAVATVLAALQAGIRQLDTAPLYGAGLSEEYVGDALLEAGLDTMVGLKVWTKVGVVIRRAGRASLDHAPLPLSFTGERATFRDYSFGMAQRGLKESLVRLRLPAVTGLRVHGPNRQDRVTIGGNLHEPMVVDGTEQAVAADGILVGLSALRNEGVIEEVSLGLNAFDPAIVQGHRRLFKRPPPGTVQSALLAGGFNLLNQNALPLLEEAEAQGIEIHMAGVFSSGLLAGGSTVYAAGADNGQAPSDELLQRVDGWRRLTEEHGVALPAVALAFAALPRCVTRVVVGMSSPADVEENVELLRTTGSIPTALWRQAKERGLLDLRTPIPC
eukprot:COSAG02_NODE_1773_length_10980_cov_8.196765_2_plen_377_part_00